jgi:hypothetical protein
MIFLIIKLIIGMDKQGSTDPLDDYVDTDPDEPAVTKEQADKLLGDDPETPMDTDPQTDPLTEQRTADSASGAGTGGVIPATDTGTGTNTGTQTGVTTSGGSAGAGSGAGPDPAKAKAGGSKEINRERFLSSTSSVNKAKHLPKAYFNIKAARDSDRTVRILNGCAVKKN